MTFKPVHDPSHLYFVTATVLGWEQLFTKPAYAYIVLNSLNWHRLHGRWMLFAYVIMPNHVHAILKPCDGHTISSVLQSFGSFTAHDILAQMREEGRVDLLAFFEQRVDRDPRKRHQIWQPIQAKNVMTAPFLREKLEYIHNNPVAKRWCLADDRAGYVYSSACLYDRGITPLVAVDDVREWLV
jgi:REP element-mobilizing transposase RayT